LDDKSTFLEKSRGGELLIMLVNKGKFTNEALKLAQLHVDSLQLSKDIFIALLKNVYHCKEIKNLAIEYMSKNRIDLIEMGLFLLQWFISKKQYLDEIFITAKNLFDTNNDSKRAITINLFECFMHNGCFLSEIFAVAKGIINSSTYDYRAVVNAVKLLTILVEKKVFIQETQVLLEAAKKTKYGFIIAKITAKLETLVQAMLTENKK
jgi:hypothetical protein